MFGLGASSSSQAQSRYSALPNASSVKIDGSSTAHDWEMEGKMIGGFIEFGPGVKLDAAATAIPGLTDNKVPVKVHAIIPVQTVHSKAEHMPDVMDHLMQEHLKSDQFGMIQYNLTGMTFKGPHTAGTPFVFDTTGELTIAGVTNTVNFPVTIEAPEASKIKVNATVPVKMTDYKVDPPAPNIGLGLMKCGNDVKIIIDWTLVQKK